MLQVLNKVYSRINNLSNVVRGIDRHTYRNTNLTIQKKVRSFAGNTSGPISEPS